MPTETKKFDPYQEWLNIAPAEQPVDYYRLLGLQTFETDAELIRDNADERMSNVRRYQNSVHSRSSQRILNELAAARSCLLDAKLRRIYDAKLTKIMNSNKLPELTGSVILLPDDAIPENYDPFQGTNPETDHDPLEPITRQSIWPILIPIFILVVATAIALITLQWM